MKTTPKAPQGRHKGIGGLFSKNLYPQLHAHSGLLTSAAPTPTPSLSPPPANRYGSHRLRSRERRADTNALLIASRTRQAFGHWSGWALDAHDQRHDLESLVGWAEEAANRW
ncbi:hypothetical protein DL240_18535 [Lujinxingia litoralis]|uniref:Uncharacterized protein n=1 Tax=Lujinxingia litoralis TaxID=2211119 RepID=A0A328C0P4_9DELT|nr:hypothetical protein DL240_18535 [Lujinxingia litoralis]